MKWMMSDAIACSAGRNINFWGLLTLIQVCIPTRERGNEEGKRGNEEKLPIIPAKHSPSFPRRRESITERPILNELTRRGLLYAFPRRSLGTRNNGATDP